MILKFFWKKKYVRKFRNVLKKKSNEKELVLLDIIVFYKVIVIKEIWC